MNYQRYSFRADQEIVKKVNDVREKLVTDYKKTDSRVMRFCVEFTHEHLDKLIDFQIKKLRGNK